MKWDKKKWSRIILISIKHDKIRLDKIKMDEIGLDKIRGDVTKWYEVIRNKMG